MATYSVDELLAWHRFKRLVWARAPSSGNPTSRIASTLRPAWGWTPFSATAASARRESPS
jgi:hypothetical protein